MEELNKQIIRRRYVAFIVFIALFFVVGYTTFLATRMLFPLITYQGRTSIYTLPTYFTFIMPLVVFYLVLMSMYAKSIHGRLNIILVLGCILLVFGLFSLIDIVLCITLLWDGRVLMHFMTPLFPLDIILLNILYILGGICALMYRRIDRKYTLSVGVSRIPFKTSQMVLAGFYIPFAAYFLGELMYGTLYLKEGFIDPNWVNMIPHYLSFMLPALYLGMYMFSRFQLDERKRHHVALLSLIILNASALIVYVWIYTSLIINPYIIAESLQWEYALGLPLKYPFGLFITTLITIIVDVTASIKLIKIRRPHYEQKQETIQ